MTITAQQITDGTTSLQATFEIMRRSECAALAHNFIASYAYSDAARAINEKTPADYYKSMSIAIDAELERYGMLDRPIFVSETEATLFRASRLKPGFTRCECGACPPQFAKLSDLR